jgi:hypothetical protein
MDTDDYYYDYVTYDYYNDLLCLPTALFKVFSENLMFGHLSVLAGTEGSSVSSQNPTT